MHTCAVCRGVEKPRHDHGHDRGRVVDEDDRVDDATRQVARDRRRHRAHDADASQRGGGVADKEDAWQALGRVQQLAQEEHVVRAVGHAQRAAAALAAVVTCWTLAELQQRDTCVSVGKVTPQTCDAIDFGGIICAMKRR